MPPPPLPAHTALDRQQAAGLITQPHFSAVQALNQAVRPAPYSPTSRPTLPTWAPRIPAPQNPTPGSLPLASSARQSPHTTVSRSPSLNGGSTQRHPPSIPTPSPSTSVPSHAIATRAAKPGSPLNPLERSPIAPASFFLAPYQPYHHVLVVIDEIFWEKRGLVVLKFDRERDWNDIAGATGSLEEGSYVTERVSCHQYGRVEQRAPGRNTPEGMKRLKIGEPDRKPNMETISKR